MQGMTTQTRIPPWPDHYRLKLAVEASGIDPRKLADELGLSHAAVYGYLRGERVPKRPTMRWIAERTGVPLWWLEGGEPPETDTGAVTLGERKTRRLVAVGGGARDTGKMPPVTDEHLRRAS